jgi:phosphate transport system substrate-binding protein
MTGRGETMRTTRHAIISLAALALLSAACGGGGNASEQTAGGVEVDPSLTGSIFVSGSSTVEPISGLVAELFSEQAPDVDITVEGPGTGDGFELFCAGETDVNDASRPIEEEEAQACRENGVTYVELEVALDGISVITGLENEEVSCLNTADLYALTGPESEGFETWADADALGTELGGIGGPYPDQPLDIVGPGEESGTYDAFVELALADLIEERGTEEATRPDYQSSPDDNVIVQGVSGYGLGWVGYAFFANNSDVVKGIEISSGDQSGCVAPDLSTIADGSYPLSRSLFVYVNAEKAAESEALATYIDYYLSDDGLVTAVEETSYVPLPADRLETTRAAWEEAVAAA